MKDVTEINETNVDDYQDLLRAFRVLPITKISRTFMEVSGYPHYENVCSNILSFYFDPAAEHGLKYLLLKAFLRMAGSPEVTLQGKVSVSREYGTNGGNRIDLVVEGEFFTIGIENKIFHWLANDLTDYARVIDRLGEKKVIVKAVLGLKHIQGAEALKDGFVSHTYGQLWQHVRELLGHYIAQADPKWVTYLIDFMETTTNLAGENMELKQTDQFFIEHNEVIEKLLLERSAFQGRLSQRIVDLAGIMIETSEVKMLAPPPYPYAKDRLVLDFEKLAGRYDISFDLYLTPSGWDLQLFGRGYPSYAYLLNLIKQPVLQEKMDNANLIDNGKRYCVQNWAVQDDLEKIREALCSWIVAINEAAKAVPN